MALNEKITNKLDKAVRDYNIAIKILRTCCTHDNMKRASGALKYLRGLTDMLSLVTNTHVILNFVDNSFYSEISGYTITLKAR